MTLDDYRRANFRKANDRRSQLINEQNLILCRKLKDANIPLKLRLEETIDYKLAHPEQGYNEMAKGLFVSPGSMRTRFMDLRALAESLGLEAGSPTLLPLSDSLKVADRIRFFAPVKPRPLGRPRMTPTGRIYVPEGDKHFRNDIRFFALKAMHDFKKDIFRSAVGVQMVFYREKPGNITSSQWGDIDNHIKAILDALTGFCFWDDSLVVDTLAAKATGKDGVDITVLSYEGVK